MSNKAAFKIFDEHIAFKKELGLKWILRIILLKPNIWVLTLRTQLNWKMLFKTGLKHLEDCWLAYQRQTDICLDLYCSLNY